MNGYIYTKQIADGKTDNCLVLNQGTAYRVPFTFGSDWNHIKLGIFLSFSYTGGGVSEGLTLTGEPGDVSNSTNLIVYSDGASGQFDNTLTANALAGATVTSIFNGTETVVGTVVSNSAAGASQSQFAYEAQVVIDTPVSFESGIGIGLRFDFAPSDGNNVAFPDYHQEDSGATSKDTFGYMGVISNDQPVTLPSDPDCSIFLGMRFNKFKVGDSTNANDKENVLGSTVNSSAPYPALYASVGNLDLENTCNVQNKIPFGPPGELTYFGERFGVDHTINYMGYFGIELEKKDQVYWIYIGKTPNLSDYESDPSLTRLNELIAGADNAVVQTPFGSNIIPIGGAPTPSCFFFYNPFFNAKARIHAWAVKKIS